MTTQFWKSVKELAELRNKIPEERRAFSGIRSTVGMEPSEHSQEAVRSARMGTRPLVPSPDLLPKKE
jgi:hypothetical protein